MGRWGWSEGKQLVGASFLLLPRSFPRPLARSAHPSSPAEPRFRSPGPASPYSWGRCRGGRQQPALANSPARTCSFRWQKGSELGVLIHATGSGIRRRLGSGWRQADAARPPGGARVQLGCLPRPAPAWPRPSPPSRAGPIDAGTRRAGPQLRRGGRDGTRSRRESPLERDSAQRGCRCVAGAGIAGARSGLEGGAKAARGHLETGAP